MEYSDKLLEHFYSPRNAGTLPDADGIGEAGDANCGDIMKIYIKVENNTIKDVRFMTFGCGSAIASSSIATELIKGKTLEEAWNLTNKSVIEALDGLPSEKIHCSVLAEQTIHKAINNYREKLGLEKWKDKWES
ncbi:FeS cluster assembly scaffold protein NifU [Clostridium argentinense CDC 2741]|uniref:FeS cluster assembly scaffold protein NifU n=1 Tax=Clostridium argentinense CDC 2741 TaxID=1418104 RepID=A0A0C1RAF6_9CLOT|nr:Fe-S cluster assembly scaffold protein NifU [Clostridium argentinense]ARC84620.1 iron-sulfur cluster assembly scaffold protein NifU [Clostridium argentinense]KIE47411.1 FeS cluster assembly scaffold protein NifU [Clostridium argentinense CDC 2741]NFF40126.1 Fe-S cluster assembly scaffold protein NifU [Clostridium argentinense]NFP50671.1 Fe-S cluster assembly scaffold protein NifU [Clostridium argentinense]NFP72381.1 Fe-S cluster assembly scaffold protein NifU [Clostridium argentinense]